MQPFHRLTSCALVAVLVAAAGLSFAVVAGAQSNPPAAQHDNALTGQKLGTGVVPPGVKLDARIPLGGAARPFLFPRAATKTLANGLRVFVVTNASEPTVAVSLVIPTAGTLNDPTGMPGVASMAATLLTQGTAKRSAEEIAETIDFVGGSLTASADEDDTSVSLNVVKKDVDLGMDLMSDVVLRPSFQQEELDRQKEQLLSSLQIDYANPSYLASAVFARVAYRGSGYGLPKDGTPDTAAKLDRTSIQKFHDHWYAPNETLIAFAGDITAEQAFATAEKYFGGWGKIALPAVKVGAPEKIAGLHFWLIDKPGAVQTQIRIGKPGIPRSNPDYIPLLVTNRIFGGGYNSRLNTEVRINKGLTYGANSSFTSLRYAGDFRAGTFTRTEATAEATRLVVDLIAKMSSGQLMPSELDFARDYLSGVYPIQSETAEQVAGRILAVAEYGLPADYNDVYPARIRSVNAEQVKGMAAGYFGANDLDLVLAGDVSKFRDAVKKAFPDAMWEEIPYDKLDLLQPNLLKTP
jgi:zinc protease